MALTWSDEFDGLPGSLPDASKWVPDVGGQGWGNQELEYYTNNQNVYQDGQSNLVIEAGQDSGAHTCWYGPSQYTSARINTKGLFSFQYGRIEACIKIPYGQGLWPAFWMLGGNHDSVGWPACGEIDIMENIGRDPSINHGTVHGPTASGNYGIGGSYTLPSGNLSDDYHIYSAEWNSAQVAFSVDGNAYFTTTKSAVQSQGGQWVFDHPFYILLNVAVGGTWPGSPDASTVLPQKMYVDYVRVYQ